MNQEQKQIMRMIRKHKKMNKFKQADKQKECCLQFWREKVRSVKTCKPTTIK